MLKTGNVFTLQKMLLVQHDDQKHRNLQQANTRFYLKENFLQHKIDLEDPYQDVKFHE